MREADCLAKSSRNSYL
ncbi:hypothetical protein [Frischella japonica]